MAVMNPNELSSVGSGQPDRTIFPPPQTVVVEQMPRSSAATRGAVIALVAMLLLTAVLGYLAYSQAQAAATAEQRLAELEDRIDEDSSELVAEKDAVIDSLREQIDRLETQIDTDAELARLVTDSESKLQEIREMLAGPKRGWGTLDRRAEWATEPVAWDEPAKEILETRVNRLEELRRQIRDWTPPATRTPSAGTIRPSD